MSISVIAAMTALRAVHAGLRLLRRGGTALPGKIALRICPDLLSTLSRGVKIIAVTGTNGKTTCSRMIEKAFEELQLNYVANRSGANLMSGITTELAMHSSLTGRCRADWAVIECDEAAARQVFGKLKPEVVVVTNLFRDQLDRYGEVTHTLENIVAGLNETPDAVLCLNADCPLTSSIARQTGSAAHFFGFGEAAASPASGAPELSDATHCLFCKGEYRYKYMTYAHLGSWYCPECGYARPEPEVEVTRILSRSADGSSALFTIDGVGHETWINLPADYNIYNAAAAVCAVRAAGLDYSAALSAVAQFHCGFGRMESFNLGARGARLMLVKNPAGCGRVLDFLSKQEDDFDLAVCLNDNAADGTDVSWIWDARFELLADEPSRLASVAASGTRAYDMAVRLKYAGVDEDLIAVEQDYERLLDRLSASERRVFIMSTYTAMLDIRRALVRRCGGTEFWEG